MGDFRPDHPFAQSTEEMLNAALTAVGADDDTLREALDDLPAPIYTTDGNGWITFFNKACVEFSGRTPIAGKDRWCVSWKLYTASGEPIDHADCPMAAAIREGREVRGMTAVAERPDGTRVTFRPYPTPLFDDTGHVIGAVNMLIDITDRRQIDHLHDQAERCRRLSLCVTDRQTLDTLVLMAEEYDEKARSLASLN